MRESISIRPDIMKSIYSFEKCIQSKDVMNQTVTVKPRPTKWERLFPDYPILNEVLDGCRKDADGQCLISRKEVFEEKDNARKAILALLWGFPNGYRNSDAGHRNVVKGVLEIAEEKNDRNLTDPMFRAMMAHKGIGLSTLSKMLYFFEYKIDGKPALILDSNVMKNMPTFSEFESIVNRSLRTFEGYASYVKRMSEIADKMNGVTPDQLEYFLFNYQKILS